MSAQMSSASPTQPKTSGAAPFWRTVSAQTRAELMMTLRRGESLLITVFIPIILLVFFASLKVGGVGINFLVPGVMALALMSTGMVSLSIATAYERYYGVLKRLGASPLSRGGLILAKTLSVLAIELAQIALLALLAFFFFGWRPTGSLPLFILIFVLGTATFSGLGMLMAGALRAEATLAGANGLYLLFVLIGGTVLPISSLPGFLQPIANALPAAALSEGLYGATNAGAFQGWSLISLLIWGIIFLGAAAFTFRWE
ncbi:MAG TPA: ABC transporter permease [Ktedonobacterales bacterium]|nr:ABC transporter permease [Ktedonobacterales bacterium]